MRAGLQRVFYTSALICIRNCDALRPFYERERAEAASDTPKPSLGRPDEASTFCGP